MKVVVLQSNYLPWKGYFDLIHDADTFIFYDEVKYTKNDWRNRNRICSKNGLQWLSIPIAKDAVKQRISEVLLPPNWQKLHFDSIYFAYKKAPYFNQIEGLIVDFYQEKTFRYLSEFNQYSIKKIALLLNITTTFLNSSDFSLEGDRVERLVSLLKQANATHYISGPSARDYLDGQEHVFTDNGITLEYKSYEGYPSYPQLCSPFEGAVSILDLLANVPQSDIPDYIWRWRSK